MYIFFGYLTSSLRDNAEIDCFLVYSIYTKDLIEFQNYIELTLCTFFFQRLIEVSLNIL